jgi:hypothetical protein
MEFVDDPLRLRLQLCFEVREVCNNNWFIGTTANCGLRAGLTRRLRTLSLLRIGLLAVEGGVATTAELGWGGLNQFNNGRI